MFGLMISCSQMPIDLSLGHMCYIDLGSLDMPECASVWNKKYKKDFMCDSTIYFSFNGFLVGIL